MKFKCFILTVTAMLLFAGCFKDENDFDALRHNIVVEGDFDPMLGVPVAKMSVSMADIVGVMDTASNMTVELNDEDIVTLKYEDKQHTVFDFYLDGKSKNYSVKQSSDTVYATSILKGDLPITLFDKINQASMYDVVAEDIFVDMNSMMKGYVSGTLSEMLTRGLEIYYDSIRLQVSCADGFRPVVLLNDPSMRVSVSELVDGKELTIIDHYNISQLVNRKLERVSFSVRMNIAVPLAQWNEMGLGNVDSLGVDSISADIHTQVSIPMRFHCDDIRYVDEQPIDLSDLGDDWMDIVEEGLSVSLSDTSYLVLDVNNYIPLSLGFNFQLIDSLGNELTGRVLAQDSMLRGAPVREIGNTYIYESAGYTKSRLSLPITRTLLGQLGKARSIRLFFAGTTSNKVSKGERPLVIMRGKDKLEMRAHVLVRPHVHFETTIQQFIK